MHLLGIYFSINVYSKRSPSTSGEQGAQRTHGVRRERMACRSQHCRENKATVINYILGVFIAVVRYPFSAYKI